MKLLERNVILDGTTMSESFASAITYPDVGRCLSYWVPQRGFRGFEKTKMRNGGGVLLAVRNLYVDTN